MDDGSHLASWIMVQEKLGPSRRGMRQCLLHFTSLSSQLHTSTPTPPSTTASGPLGAASASPPAESPPPGSPPPGSPHTSPPAAPPVPVSPPAPPPGPAHTTATSPGSATPLRP